MIHADEPEGHITENKTEDVMGSANGSDHRLKPSLCIVGLGIGSNVVVAPEAPRLYVVHPALSVAPCALGLSAVQPSVL